MGELVICPICETRTLINQRKSHQRNVLAEYYLQKVLHESVEAFCDNCEKGLSAWYCNTCSSSMCIDCYNLVHSAPLFKKHSVVPFGEREMRTVCPLPASFFF